MKEKFVEVYICIAKSFSTVESILPLNREHQKYYLFERYHSLLGHKTCKELLQFFSNMIKLFNSLYSESLVICSYNIKNHFYKIKHNSCPIIRFKITYLSRGSFRKSNIELNYVEKELAFMNVPI